jgi:small subunit ribosomal protein S21
MSEIVAEPGVPFEVTLKRFNRKIQEAGILAEARRRRYYESPRLRRKRKAEANRRKKQRSRYR